MSGDDAPIPGPPSWDHAPVPRPQPGLAWPRTLVVILGLVVWLGLSFTQAWMIFDARPSEPWFRGIHEANDALPWAYLAGGLWWAASWLPSLSRATRIRCLWACGALWVLACIAAFAWALLRYGTTPRQ